MLNISQFRELIVKPVLTSLMLYSPGAEELMVFTCANESLGGTYIKQVDGPALGIYQMEPATYDDIWHTFIMNHDQLRLIFMSNFNLSNIPSPARLIYDLHFATAMARLHYDRFRDPIPDPKDLEGLWNYYKEFYNTSKGSAQKDSALDHYHRFCLG